MRILSLIFSLGLISQVIVAQNCLPQGINFFNQAVVDNFQTSYPGCVFIEGDVTIGDGYPTDITNLNGLDVLTGIGGEFNVEDQTNLSSFVGLDNLDSINGDVYLYLNESLTSLNGLGRLTKIGGDVSINQNVNLTGFDGLDSLQRIEGSLQISNHPSVTSFSGFETVEYLGGFAMGGNHFISNFTGFEGLTMVGGNFIVQDGDLLNSLDGLNNLTTVSGTFNINGDFQNHQISSIDALASLTSVGGLSFGFMTIDNINALSALTTVTGDFSIAGCHNLQSLQGLENLTSTEGFRISACHSLQSLHGLENLSTVGGAIFTISNNDSLVSLEGLQNVVFPTFVQFNIHTNAVLTECAISSLCDYLGENPTGLINIFTNGVGCSSAPEIEQACISAGVEDQESLSFSLYPNPSQDLLNIRIDDAFEVVKLEIFNSNGQLVKELVSNTNQELINLNFELLSGLYVIRLVTSNSESSTRFMVSNE